MKVLKFTFLLLILSCYFVEAQNKTLAVKHADVQWEGHKITSSHQGNISLKKGLIVVNNNNIKGGKFIIDMNSINCTDLTGDSKIKLEEHLKNEDFFNVKKYPESTLEFTGIQKKSPTHYLIKADLQIKGITHPISFDLYTKGKKAQAKLEIDRTKYGIKYGSSSFFADLGDYAISNKFDLQISFKY